MKDAARTAAAAVDGWLNETQGEALFDAAARCSGRGAIVEIGKTPEVHHLIERSDFGLEEANQIAEIFQLHRQRAFFIERQPLAHFQRLEGIGSVIDIEHLDISLG